MTNNLIKGLLCRGRYKLFSYTREIDTCNLFRKITSTNSRNSLKIKNLPSERYKIEMSATKPRIVFVLGGPGAGKGTQCKKIVDNFGFVHLSAGDLLREERAREGSEYGELIEDKIKNGEIVPVEITCSLIENAMNKNIKEFNKNKFLIDGFPRNQDNLDGWTSKMAGKVNLLFVLFFDCSEDVCVDRCLTRGKAGSGRCDDNLESLKKRIQTYQKDSLPIIEYYKKLDLVRRIDASPEPEVVFENVRKVFFDCQYLESGDH